VTRKVRNGWEGGTISICDSRQGSYFTLFILLGLLSTSFACLGWSLDADDLRSRGVKDCTLLALYIDIGWDVDRMGKGWDGQYA